MTAPVIDSRGQSKELHSAISAHVPSYDYGKVPGADGNPGALPPVFVLLAVERRFNPSLRLSATAPLTSYRATSRAVGRSVAECEWALAKVTAALNEQRITVGGRTSTPIQFESAQAPGLDDQHYSGLIAWTYTL